ncbi:MAG: Xaa-Pro peptidase family protein [Actinobacteria bacterium]|nr:Xaa-Pro peptidase family protein [Chloroflexota bacterium]MCL5292306.1 Xaa-Pro peptidase family protein [Actinomycetota bacterium]
MYDGRLRKLELKLAESGLDAFLISNPHNVYYLTGFYGALGGDQFFLLVAPGEAVLPVDFRYLEEAMEEASVRVVEWKERTFNELVLLLPEGTRRLGFEADALTVDQHRRLEETAEVELVPTSRVVGSLRLHKDQVEIERISMAAALADAAFEHAVGILEPGLTERDVASEIECFMRRRGADKPSFETIVASGSRSAIPHACSTGKPIAVGDFVKIDLGASIAGYSSDMTRTVVVGEAAAEQRKIYKTVLTAQAAALELIGPGVSCREVDAAARSIIDGAGYAGRFAHGLGHGVGLEVHESPTLSPKSDEVLEPGVVVTIEPGVYVAGLGGVRIEDMVLVTGDGKEILSHAPKELIQI